MRGPRNLQAMSNFHCSIIRFVRTREQAVRASGLEPLQYQFLTLVEPLYANGGQPNISKVASRLGMRHHSAVELVDRLEERGLLERKRGKHDRRHVFLHATPEGKKLLRRLVAKEQRAVRLFAPELLQSLKHVLHGNGAKATRQKG